MSAAANAAIVYSGVVNINIPSTQEGVYLNVMTGVTGSTGGSVAGWDVNPYSTTGLRWFSSTGGGYARGGGDSTSRIDNLVAGTLIDSGLSYGAGSSETTGATAFLLNSSGNLAGFRFVDESTSLTHYGWMRISLDSSLVAQPRTIVEYAYESVAGVGILAGATGSAVPSGGLAGMMLAGVAGIGGRRRR